MRRFRSIALAASVIVVSLGPDAAPIAAQGVGRAIDEGTFLITKTGAPSSTESFKIVRTDDGILQATARVTSGSQRLTSKLRTDSLGTPLEYSLLVNDGKATVLKIVAAAQTGRLSTQSTDQRGDVSMHEYPMSNGRSLILGDDFVHPLYFAALGKRAGALHVIDPRSSRGGTATLTARGLEPVDVGGRSATGTHYTLTVGAEQREFWVDPAGRLLRVEVPALGLKATREELPQ
jgi:hypothetical protein